MQIRIYTGHADQPAVSHTDANLRQYPAALRQIFFYDIPQSVFSSSGVNFSSALRLSSRSLPAAIRSRLCFRYSISFLRSSAAGSVFSLLFLCLQHGIFLIARLQPGYHRVFKIILYRNKKLPLFSPLHRLINKTMPARSLTVILLQHIRRSFRD